MSPVLFIPSEIDKTPGWWAQTNFWTGSLQDLQPAFLRYRTSATRTPTCIGPSGNNKSEPGPCRVCGKLWFNYMTTRKIYVHDPLERAKKQKAQYRCDKCQQIYGSYMPNWRNTGLGVTFQFSNRCVGVFATCHFTTMNSFRHTNMQVHRKQRVGAELFNRKQNYSIRQKLFKY